MAGNELLAIIAEDWKRHVTKLRPYLNDATFGRGGLPQIKGFFELSYLEQTLFILWQNGCRVPSKSINMNTLE